jgi:MYXO-CTERM domain-containing protein
LRHDCGNPGDCVKTCGGPANPACIDAIPGTECLPSECLDDALHGLGPAFCPAPGAKCAINDRVPFDCAPYRCVKQSGQCGLQCASSDDCAPPFVCDPEQRCVPPPPVASGQPSTCAAAPGPSSSAPGVTALFAALAASYLRRRRRPAAPYRAKGPGAP